jgi:RNA polymerase sigma-32 factor
MSSAAHLPIPSLGDEPGSVAAPSRRRGRVALHLVEPVPVPPAPPTEDAELPRGVPRDRRLLMTYLREVRRHPVMSREEEHEVAARFVKTGDQKLADRLVKANLRLVLKIVFEYRLPPRNLMDFIQEGNVGLVHGVQKYDPHRGVKLATYVVWWIRAYVLKYMLANARLVKLGTTCAQRKLFFGLGRARKHLEGKSGAVVSTHDLAAAMGLPEREVAEMEKRLASVDASLDAPTHVQDDRTLIDTIDSAEEGADVEIARNELHARLGRELEVFGGRLT